MHVYSLVLIKGDHKYIFLYSIRERKELVRRLLEWAADPRFNLGWREVLDAILRLRCMEDRRRLTIVIRAGINE